MVDYIVDDDAFSEISYSMIELVDTSINYNTVITEQHDVIFLCSDANRTAVVFYKRRDDIDIPIYLCSWSDSGLLAEMIHYYSHDVFMYTNRNIQHEESYTIFESDFTKEYGQNPTIGSMYGHEIMYMVYFSNASSEGINDTFIELTNSYDPYRGLFFDYYNNQHGDYYTIMGLYEIKNHDFVKQNIVN